MIYLKKNPVIISQKLQTTLNVKFLIPSTLMKEVFLFIQGINYLKKQNKLFIDFQKYFHSPTGDTLTSLKRKPRRVKPKLKPRWNGSGQKQCPCTAVKI